MFLHFKKHEMLNSLLRVDTMKSMMSESACVSCLEVLIKGNKSITGFQRFFSFLCVS